MTIPRVTKFSTHEFFHPRIFSRLLTSFAYRASGVTKFKTTKINSEDPRQLFTKISTPENYPLYGIPLAAFQNVSLTNLEMLISTLKKIGVFLSKLAFTIPEVKVFLSERLCRDPLESFLGANASVVEQVKTRILQNFAKILKLSK